ncbi:uncharacterized protein LOC135710319 [Ochlerotatus camptorhynchus]|uniref:uncharacterized protein LOC135710319 n=1 Tax=Ochlerotatus camptorhynchus TaxID=644619 RepID=UPI0031D8463E
MSWSTRSFECALVFIVLCELRPAWFTGMELQLQGVEQISGTELIDADGLRIMKFNRTLAVMNGTIHITRDIGDLFEFRISVAYSRIGNNQFVEYPMKIAKENVCKVLNGPYREYQYLWANTTNFPQVAPEERLCPLPKGWYWIKNYAPDAAWVPSVVPEGLWRMTLDILDVGGDIQCQFRSYTWLRKPII